VRAGRIVLDKIFFILASVQSCGHRYFKKTGFA
jgi:hypothetical protein